MNISSNKHVVDKQVVEAKHLSKANVDALEYGSSSYNVKNYVQLMEANLNDIHLKTIASKN